MQSHYQLRKEISKYSVLELRREISARAVEYLERVSEAAKKSAGQSENIVSFEYICTCNDTILFRKRK